MKKPEPAFSWEEMDALRVSAGVGDDAIPGHAFTVKAYCERYGVGNKAAGDQLRKLWTNGFLKRGFRNVSGNRLVYYWPAK